MQRRMRAAIVGAAVCAVTLPGAAQAHPLAASPTAVSVAARAVATPTAARAVTLRPLMRPAITAEHVTFRAALGTSGVRPVTLQVARSGRWVVAARGRTTARGDVRLAHRVSPVAGTAHYRLVAPAARIGKRTLPVITTATAAVRIAGQSATLRLPTGASGYVRVQASPARPGRVVTLQEYRDGDWVKLGSGKQDARGRVAFAIARRSGQGALRGVVARANGAPSSATAPASWPTAGAVSSLNIGNTPDDRVYNWINWAAPDAVSYARTAEGNLAVIARESSGKVLRVDTFNPQTYQRVGEIKRISLAGWSEWGGAYSAPDGHHYVLVGNLNDAENDDADVVEVRRYDASWGLVGTAHVKGGASQAAKGISHPFEGGAPHMALVEDRLVVHMGREMYRLPDGLRHQSNLTFEVDVPTMAARTFDDVNGDRWGSPYVSHSFQQLVAMHGSNLVFIDHGDGYPRSILMSVIAGYPDNRKLVKTELMAFPGEEGDNYTGASVTGLVSGPKGIVVIGDQVQAGAAQDEWLSRGLRNVFAIVADPATGAHQTRWLTKYAASGSERVSNPRVTPLGGDQFAVLFDVEVGTKHRTEYRLIDSGGKVLGSASFPGMFFASGSEPITVGGKLLWAGGAPGGSGDHPQDAGALAYLYGLDITRPRAPKQLSR